MVYNLEINKIIHSLPYFLYLNSEIFRIYIDNKTEQVEFLDIMIN